MEARKVEKIQEIYLEALQAYVMNHRVRPMTEFAKLLSVLTELRTLGNLNSEMCFSLKLKNKKLPPFLAEIWDVHSWKNGSLSYFNPSFSLQIPHKRQNKQTEIILTHTILLLPIYIYILFTLRIFFVFFALEISLSLFNCFQGRRDWARIFIF